MTRIFDLDDMREQLDEIEAEFGSDTVFLIGEQFSGSGFQVTAANEDGDHPNIGHVEFHSSAFKDPNDARGLLHSNGSLFGTVIIKREYLSDEALSVVDDTASEERDDE